MIRRVFLLLSVFTVFSVAGRASDYTFEYTPACAQAYRAYLALRPQEGDALIREELAARPDNLMAVYIADYGDFLTLLFNGDPAQRALRAPYEAERLKRLSRAGDHHPWKRLTMAGIHLHWAIIHIRFGEQFRAAASFRRSYSLLRENVARFPAFAPNAVLYGAEEAIAGTIPDEYSWLMAVLGMKGNLHRGMARVAGYLKANPSPDAPFREEALIYDIYLRYYLASAKSSVWQMVSHDASFDIRGNLLRAFVRANLALSFRRADEAVHTLQAAAAMPGSGAYPVFDYETGSALLMRLDPAATGYLERYAARNKGKLFTKDALQQAALGWYLKGDKARAISLRTAILQQGSLLTDADKQAQRFAKSNVWPHPLLLTARVLIDGGDYRQALGRLRSTSAAAFPDIADRLEYDFRLGRALEETGDAAGAVQAYQRVINTGRNRPEHFAARSALQMGGIYEQRGQKAEARRYYELCLSMRNHDFQSSIDQQAKAGLAR